MGIGNIGWTELLMIGVIVLVFFGPRRLPEIANAIGRSLREFRKALNEVRDEITQSDEGVRGSTPGRMDYAAGFLERFAGVGARAEGPKSEPAATATDGPEARSAPEDATGGADSGADPTAAGASSRAGAPDSEREPSEAEAGKGSDADPRDSNATAH